MPSNTSADGARSVAAAGSSQAAARRGSQHANAKLCCPVRRRAIADLLLGLPQEE